MKGYKIEIHVEPMPNKQESFWYYGQDIASVQYPNGKKLIAMAAGEIAVQLQEFDEDGDEGLFYKNSQAVEKAEELGYTDVEIGQIAERDGWRFNNWFTIVEVDANGVIIGHEDLCICYEYDEVMTVLEELAIEFQQKYYK